MSGIDAGRIPRPPMRRESAMWAPSPRASSLVGIFPPFRSSRQIPRKNVNHRTSRLLVRSPAITSAMVPYAHRARRPARQPPLQRSHDHDGNAHLRAPASQGGPERVRVAGPRQVLRSWWVGVRPGCAGLAGPGGGVRRSELARPRWAGWDFFRYGPIFPTLSGKLQTAEKSSFMLRLGGLAPAQVELVTRPWFAWRICRTTPAQACEPAGPLRVATRRVSFWSMPCPHFDSSPPGT